MSGGEEMVQCPYNMAHMILKRRMATHLVKCRQQHPTESYKTCPFNTTHDVPAPELQYHIGICPDRKHIERYIYVMEDAKPEDVTPVNIDLPSTSENWDEECSGGSYLNVKDKELEKQKVFRQPIGMSKTERKTFHHQEVQKFSKPAEKASTSDCKN